MIKMEASDEHLVVPNHIIFLESELGNEIPKHMGWLVTKLGGDNL